MKWEEPELDHFVAELNLPGERVSPGTYQQLGSNTQVQLYREGELPFCTNGHTAYFRIDNDQKRPKPIV